MLNLNADCLKPSEFFYLTVDKATNAAVAIIGEFGDKFVICSIFSLKYFFCLNLLHASFRS